MLGTALDINCAPYFLVKDLDHGGYRKLISIERKTSYSGIEAFDEWVSRFDSRYFLEGRDISLEDNKNIFVVRRRNIYSFREPYDEPVHVKAIKKMKEVAEKAGCGYFSYEGFDRPDGGLFERKALSRFIGYFKDKETGRDMEAHQIKVRLFKEL
jgi:hypothetical protein